MELKARIAGEKRVARAAVDALLAAGFELAIHNGGEDYEVGFTTNSRKLYAGLQLCDEERIFARKPGQKGNAWLHLVYGNSPWELIADYTMSLEDWLGEGSDVDQLARKIEARDAGVKFKPGPPCQVFALCTHEATGTMTHPVLGEVPACTRCKNKLERIATSV
jgi:hypothetical protein